MALQSLWDEGRIGDPTFYGLTLGAVFDPDDLPSRQFVKADHPGVRAIRIPDGTVLLVTDLPDPYTVPAAGGGGTTTIGPLGTLGYAQTATPQTGISTDTNVANTAVTVTVGASRRIRVTGQAQVIQRTAVGTPTGYIKEGGTILGRWLRHTLQVNEQASGAGSVILNPSAGSHTYVLALATSAGTVDTTASATELVFCLVEDITLTEETIDAGATTDLMELWY